MFHGFPRKYVTTKLFIFFKFIRLYLVYKLTQYIWKLFTTKAAMNETQTHDFLIDSPELYHSSRTGGYFQNRNNSRNYRENLFFSAIRSLKVSPVPSDAHE